MGEAAVWPMATPRGFFRFPGLSAARARMGEGPGDSLANGRQTTVRKTAARFRAADAKKRRSPGDCGGCMEQMTGIEPAYSAWEADTLPLSYICGISIAYIL